MRFAALIAMLLTLMVAPHVRGDELSGKFAQGNKYFEGKQYDSAIATYEAVLDEGVVSAALYFNLGNAYFRNGDLGHAILNYYRARRLDPSDPDINDNLEFAQRLTSVQMEGVKLNPVSSFFESLVAPFRLSTLAWIASAFFIALFVLLTLRYGFLFRGSLVRTGIVLVLVLTVAAALLTTFKYNREYLTRRAVIINDDSVVRTGPSESSDRELQASAGLVVEILSETGDYYNVLFENQRRGWIRTDLVAVI